MRATYQILDEPQASPISDYVVNPLWPLLSIMLAGVWLAVPWFIFNHFAMGDRERWRTLIIALSLLVALGLAIFGIILLLGAGVVDESSVKYVLLIPVALKLGVAYWLFMRQQLPFDLHEHFNESVKSGLLPLLAGSFFLDRHVNGLIDSGVWRLMVG